MGSVNIDNTGSGADVTLSSDGTDLLLDGTAIGGGGAALELYAENPVTPTAPSATGDNAVAIGHGSLASGDKSIALGWSSASGVEGVSIAIDNNTTNYGARGVNSISIGKFSTATNTSAVAVGETSSATGNKSSALGYNAVSAGTFSHALTNSYASGTDSLAAAIANNTSSYGATGANSIAMGPTARASSSGAVSLGGISGAPSLASNSLAVALGWATASGSGAVAIGNNSHASATQFNSVAISGNASATYSTAIGKSSDNQNSAASGSGALGLSGGLAQGQDSFAALLDAQSAAANSVAIGSRARANQIGKYVFANGRFAVAGDVQTGTFVLRSDTTDATPEALTTNNSTAGTTNQVVLPNNSAYAFHGTIVARQQASAGTASAAWKIEGLIRREGSAGTTVLVNSATTVLDNTPNWGMTLSADTTNGGLKVEATGAASTDIRWVATIHTSEVTYA